MNYAIIVFILRFNKFSKKWHILLYMSFFFLCMTTIFCNFEGTDTTKLSHLEFTFALLSG